MSRILRFFVCLGTLFFAGNALAAGYSCSSLPKYLSCQPGYYMTSSQSSTTYNGTPRVGNYCQPCSRKGSNYTCAGGTAAPVENAGGYTCPTYKKYTSCSPGYYMTDSSTSKTYNGTPKAGNACRPCSVYGANYTCAGGLAAPQSITINVTCPVGQYLPQGATSCTTCPAGSFCPGKTCNGVSLVTGATSACGLSSCSTNTGALYTNSASGSSYINDCYLTLNNGEAVEGVNGGKFECRSGYYCDNGGRKIYYDANNEERGLTDSRPTVAPGTACARGSYSGYSASSCDACQDGATTSGTGLDYCDAECSNSANVETWVTPTWTPNYVSNSCKIASCVACTKGTGVASCSASIENNACKYTATCASGYKNPTCNGSSCSCELDSVTCSAGQYLPAGATSCATCPKGYKCPSSSKTYTVSTTADQGNTPCSGSTEYQDATGQTSCKTPSDGYYKKDNTSQQVCGTGYFCKSGARTACTTYGTGYTTDTTTASVNTQCYLNVAGGKVRNGTTGTTLNTCGVGKFKRPHQAYYGTSYSCDSCPAAESGWTMGTDTGLTNYTACYETKAATSISNYCSAGQLKKNGTSTTTWGTATISTAFQAKGGSIVKGQTCEQCGAGTYSAGGTATSCSTCDTAYPYSDAGTSSAGSCYKNGTKTGSQLNGSTPTNCYSVTSWNSCTPGTCTYRIYKSGTTTSCTPTNCTKMPAAVTAKSGYRTNGTSCTACPSGYPNSADGNSGGITACYSNSKSRAWTGSQVNGSTPTNCYSVTSWNACSLPACSYVAYSNSSGNGDGTIKSGCSTNSANCTKTPAAVTAKSGYYVSGTSCTPCSGLASGMYPNSDNGNTGGASACRTNSLSGQVIATPNASSATQCVAGTYKAAHTVNYGSTSSCSACTGRTKYSAANASACSTVSTGYYTTGCNSNNNCTGQSQCTSGTWCASGVQNQCSSLTGVSVSGGTYTSAAGSSANTACKYTAPNKTITGCKTVTTNTVTYSGTAWPATTYGVTANGGYIISGNNTATATCSQCGTAKYSAGGTATSCSSCPNADSGWTATSPAGSTAYTACYEYQTPVNCASGSVKRAASSATAYSSTISLLSTLKSKAGYYASTTATSCTICPAGSSCAASATAPTTCANWTYAASTGMSSCKACPALTSGWTKADSTGTGWKSHTSCVQISPKPANCAGGNLKQVAASNGATTWGASTVNSALSSEPGYYIDGTACSACTGATYYGGGTATSCTPCPSIYTSNTTAAKSKAEQCTVQTTGGYYIKAAKDSKQTECDGGYYCPSATVAYGSTNTQTACPVPADHKRATIPAEYYTNSIANTYIAMSGRKSAITECQVLNTYNGTRGSLYDYVTYNTTTRKYDVQGSVLWFKANPGYYLTTATGCGTYAYYGVAKECDKNAYCPGKDQVECNSSNQATVQVEKFGLELCSALGNGKYATSDGGAAAKSTAACYLTTSNSKFVAAAGAAEGACTAGGWCPGGIRVNYGSTGGRNTCPTKYPSSAASSNSELDCYVTTAAGKYVATVGAGQVNCAGTGYYCPGGTNVYSGAYGSRLTTGGRTQCPAGYRDLVATASTTKEAQCTMNVAGGKYVKVAKESAASGTCVAGYAKAAHSVTYGNTSSCAACTGTTYAENTGQASCTACPTQSGVTNISYWISTGTHTDANGCYGFYNDVALNNGSAARIQCFWDKTKSQYDTSCGAMKDGLKCNAAYYNAALESSPTNNAAYYTDKASVIAKACTSVGKGYWSPADVYTRTQCPAGYRDGAAGVSESQCTMNVAGGKYVKVAKESAASGTCVAGYAKAAHSVTYGNTSSCAACTGATYAASTGQATCTTCPTAKTYASAVKSYDYWNTGKDGDHTISDGCYATMTGTLSNGSLTEHGCYLGTDGDYGNGGGKRCYVHQDNLKCNAGYYASTLSNGYVWNNTRAGLLGNTCVGVGAGYYSAANILTRNQCPTGLTTIGYGAGADEVTDCGRILHFGNDKLYLRSGKKTTPSLNVKIGDTTYYGNMTAGTGKGKLRLKSGTTTYSVHDDSM